MKFRSLKREEAMNSKSQPLNLARHFEDTKPLTQELPKKATTRTKPLKKSPQSFRGTSPRQEHGSYFW